MLSWCMFGRGCSLWWWVTWWKISCTIQLDFVQAVLAGRSAQIHQSWTEPTRARAHRQQAPNDDGLGRHRPILILLREKLKCGLPQPQRVHRTLRRCSRVTRSSSWLVRASGTTFTLICSCCTCYKREGVGRGGARAGQRQCVGASAQPRRRGWIAALPNALRGGRLRQPGRVRGACRQKDVVVSKDQTAAV
jgi:hypothetical protein